MAMGTLYLHAGLHKTGTTALQRFLHDNRAALGKDGAVYPSAGMIPDRPANRGQHELAWALRRGDDGRVWERLREEIEGAPAAVVSSEEFSRTPDAASYRPAIDALRGWRLIPVIYLRRQDEFLESMYNYNVRALGETASIMEFAARVRRRLDFRHPLKVLVEAFGRESVRVRLYGRAELKGSIFEDFLDCIGIGDIGSRYAMPRKAVNPGLTLEGLELMRAANERHRDDAAALAKERGRIGRKHAASPFARHGVLTDEQREEILGRYERPNAWIARTFLEREHLFLPRETV